VRSFVTWLVLFVGAFTPSEAQFTQQGNKLIGSGISGTTAQGTSVALSGDGNTAAIGGLNYGGSPGGVWVFTRKGNVWSQQGNHLISTGAVGTDLGSSVSLSADGNTLVAGGHWDNNLMGAVWVFTRTDSVWSQEGSKLVGVGAAAASWLGYSVSLSADGNTALVGAPYDGLGSVWVFTRTNGVWSQQGGKLNPAGAKANYGPYISFGFSVSLSGDGNTAIAGAYGDDSLRGAAWIFTRANGVWTQQGSKIAGLDTVNDHGGGFGARGARFGTSVALSGDGNTALVGEMNNGPWEYPTGAGWVFTRANGVWTPQGNKLVGSVGPPGIDNWGFSAALSADGNTAMIGDIYHYITGQGAIFTRTSGLWSQLGSSLVGTGAVYTTVQPGEGYSVALSGDGNTAIMGGDYDNHGVGAAWVFTRFVASIQELGFELPQQFAVEQNYPNPFNPSTIIRYVLSQRSRVTLTVFNTLGQKVAQLVNGEIDAGHHEVRFDGSDLASGVYFYSIQAGSFVQTKQLLLLR
jgi:hypothetical protein